MSRIKSFSFLTSACALLVAAWALADGGSPAAPSHPTARVQSVSAAKSGALRHHPTPRLDLNGATKEDLMKLPGVTDEMAGKIVAARPFKTKSELLSRGIVSKAEYSKLATRVTARTEAVR